MNNLDGDFKETKKEMFAGKEYSMFFPAKLSIPLLKEYDIWAKLTFGKNKKVSEMQKAMADLVEDPDRSEQSLYQQCKIVSVFTYYHDEKMTYDWLMKNVKIGEITRFFSVLINYIIEEIQELKIESKSKKKVTLNGNE